MRFNSEIVFNDIVKEGKSLDDFIDVLLKGVSQDKGSSYVAILIKKTPTEETKQLEKNSKPRG